MVRSGPEGGAPSGATSSGASPLAEQRRIGILGGTFNPVHLGHLVAAEEVGEEFALERVCLIPGNLPSHKGHDEVIPAFHRLKMAQLAAASNPRLEVLALEIERGGVSYTIETLGSLSRIYPEGTEFYFIVGQDVFKDIATWRDVPGLFRSTHFVVVQRPDLRPEELRALLEETVTARFREIRFHPVGFDRRFRAEGLRVEPSGKMVWMKAITYFDVSSTAIRRRVALGQSIRYLVPEGVAAYIQENRLYARAAGVPSVLAG